MKEGGRIKLEETNWTNCLLSPSLPRLQQASLENLETHAEIKGASKKPLSSAHRSFLQKYCCAQQDGEGGGLFILLPPTTLSIHLSPLIRRTNI